MQNILEKENKHAENIKILQELATTTIKPVKIIEFTINYEPIPFPGVDMGLRISEVIKDICDAGIKIIDTSSVLQW